MDVKLGTPLLVTPKSIWRVLLALEMDLRIPLILELYSTLLYDRTSMRIEGSD